MEYKNVLNTIYHTHTHTLSPSLSLCVRVCGFYDCRSKRGQNQLLQNTHTILFGASLPFTMIMRCRGMSVRHLNDVELPKGGGWEYAHIDVIEYNW